MGDLRHNKFDQPTGSFPRKVYISIAYCVIGIFLTLASFALLVRISSNLFISLLALTILLGIFSIVAIMKGIDPIVTIFLISLGLAFLSFSYQSFGPERKAFGTECQPIRDCFRPVLVGGFPVRYIIDVPGISVQNDLGFEDDFRIWSFIADVCFYICLMSLIYRIFGPIYILIRKSRQANQSLERTRDSTGLAKRGCMIGEHRGLLPGRTPGSTTAQSRYARKWKYCSLYIRR